MNEGNEKQTNEAIDREIALVEHLKLDSSACVQRNIELVHSYTKPDLSARINHYFRLLIKQRNQTFR